MDFNIVDKIRNEYLAAVLRQDAEWFDANPSGVITSQLNDNIDRIQDGMGDKLGLLVRGFSMFFSSVIVCGKGEASHVENVIHRNQVNAVNMRKGEASHVENVIHRNQVNAVNMREAMKSHLNSASICEESIMNVRTVQSCNGQQHMVKKALFQKYTSSLQRTLKYSLRNHFWMGFFEGLSFLQIYAVIGLALWWVAG
ncbi:unnamed protein product [Strongylus vulgaris]|uniref:ABC transmembrane type-1 domain-containing protein n=1 Tax=Strongylus vulgaris TaxID=40348 RepID=A0A3P7LUC6_STRVU|nr:unnamed protein product [Strongylus vulgaris]